MRSKNSDYEREGVRIKAPGERVEVANGKKVFEAVKDEDPNRRTITRLPSTYTAPRLDTTLKPIKYEASFKAINGYGYNSAPGLNGYSLFLPRKKAPRQNSKQAVNPKAPGRPQPTKNEVTPQPVVQPIVQPNPLQPAPVQPPHVADASHIIQPLQPVVWTPPKEGKLLRIGEAIVIAPPAPKPKQNPIEGPRAKKGLEKPKQKQTYDQRQNPVLPVSDTIKPKADPVVFPHITDTKEEAKIPVKFKPANWTPEILEAPTVVIPEAIKNLPRAKPGNRKEINATRYVHARNTHDNEDAEGGEHPLSFFATRPAPQGQSITNSNDVKVEDFSYSNEPCPSCN